MRRKLLIALGILCLIFAVVITAVVVTTIQKVQKVNVYIEDWSKYPEASNIIAHGGTAEDVIATLKEIKMDLELDLTWMIAFAVIFYIISGVTFYDGLRKFRQERL